MNIYLVGFMGTGKSSVAQELARQKKYIYADIDGLIEKKEKRAITDIFAENKEPYFRKIEKETLLELSRKPNLVVACGGGIVLDPDNIRAMKQTGLVVCLTASPQIILERTRVFKHRPLLNVPDPMQRIENMLKERAPFYAQADIAIDTSFLSVKEVADRIAEFISKKHGQT